MNKNTLKKAIDLDLELRTLKDHVSNLTGDITISPCPISEKPMLLLECKLPGISNFGMLRDLLSGLML